MSSLRLIRRLLEFNLGETPDVIHPERKRKVVTGDHPLNHPAMPLAHQHQFAADAYKGTMSKVTHYMGQTPRSRGQAMVMAGGALQNLMDIIQREKRHKPALERLAVDTVLKMPEFSSIKSAIQAGNLKIKATLVSDTQELSLDGTKTTDDEQEPEPDEFNVPQIRQEIDDEVDKRKMINSFIQGAAVSNNYAFQYYAGEELNQIDPSLVKKYGALMSATEIGYWLVDDQTIKASADGAKVGVVKLDQEEDGVPTIVATGVAFPVLVQELIKGIMEYLSHNDEDDPETRKHALNKADMLDHETWNMLLGPGLWKKFLEAVGHDAREVVPHLYDHLVKLPTSEFNRLVSGIIKGEPKAMAEIKSLAQQAKAELDGGDQPEPDFQQ